MHNKTGVGVQTKYLFKYQNTVSCHKLVKIFYIKILEAFDDNFMMNFEYDNNVSHSSCTQRK